MSTTETAPVVVGVDGTDASFHALDRAIKFAKAFDVEVIIAFIRQLPMVFGDEPAQVVEVYEDSLDDAQKETKERANAMCQAAGIKWRLLIRDGDAARQLVDTANEFKASLIVVGAHRHGVVSSVIRATIASYLDHHSDVSFVVVRPEAGE